MEPEQTCAFDALFEINVPHILERIFLSFDNYHDYKTCLKVNKTWNELLSTAEYHKKLIEMFPHEMLMEKKIKERQLHTASEEGNTEEVIRLMANLNVDVNSEVALNSWHRSTPLVRAAYGDHNDVVELMIDAGADVNMGDRFGDTPLHWASLHGNIDMAKQLLEAGADIDADHSRVQLLCREQQEKAMVKWSNSSLMQALMSTRQINLD